ncbi:MAG TPA: Gfo/Idh/MocA family oxidoreductase [Vicinamibacterales bacterium]|nr:Gfo/Idh/MocA family oxidoreductase [Vicinamibacterales bacterium]
MAKREQGGAQGTKETTRREFLRTAATAAAAGVLAQVDLPGAYAAGSDEIRVGLVGCGGRGTGAAGDALEAAPGVRLVAMGDLFADRLEQSYQRLSQKYGALVDVPPERRFTGFDAYRHVIASDVNYVILATPPGFRPAHLEAAVAAGRHIFTEKPVAVDATGVRTCLRLHEEAQRRGLGIVAGTQRRHQRGYLETIARLHDGAIGEIVAARCYWNQGFLWKKDRQPEWSDVEWQIRNWLYFTWLSGDHIVEQHIHNIDVINWVKRAHPVRALSLGGRQVRTGPEWGHIYDHFATEFEYADGTRLFSMCRQIDGCANRIGEAVTGTRGSCEIDKYTITGERPWRFERKDNRPYVQEHTDLIESIRAGRPLNELRTVAESTMTAIMGRMSAYTGQVVTWDEALASPENLMPERLEFGPMPVPPVAMPGQTTLSAGTTIGAR